MLSSSGHLRQILIRSKAVKLSAQSFVSCSVATRLFRNPIVLRQSRHNPHTKCISSTPFGFSWIWPFFAIVNRFIGSSQSITSQASPDNESLVLSEIFSTVENDPRTASKKCDAYVDKLCRCGNLYGAVKLIKFLQDKCIFVGPKAYDLLLIAASQKDNIDLLSEVFKDAMRSPGSLSPTSYLNLAKAFMKTNDSVPLLRFINDVSDMTFPSVAVLNRIIFAFAECRQTDWALLIFCHIKSLKCKPDLVTYNIILDILGRAGRVTTMLLEFVSMKEAGIIPDVISYNTLLNSLKKAGRIDICAVYFKEMGDNGIAPDLLTYTALIEAYGRSGNVEEALRLFSEMKARQIRPSIYIYRSLTTCLKKMGKLDLAMAFLEEMNSSLSHLAGPKDFKRNQRILDLGSILYTEHLPQSVEETFTAFDKLCQDIAGCLLRFLGAEGFDDDWEGWPF